MINNYKLRLWLLQNLRENGANTCIRAISHDECSQLSDMLRPFVPEANYFWDRVRSSNSCTLYPTSHEIRLNGRELINFSLGTLSKCIDFPDFLSLVSDSIPLSDFLFKEVW